MRASLKTIAFLAVLTILVAFALPITSTITYSSHAPGKYLIIYNNTRLSDSMIYFLDYGFQVPIINPLTGNNTVKIKDPFLGSFTGQYTIDFKLPNGTQVHTVGYQILVYGDPYVHNITIKKVITQYLGGPDQVLDINIIVLYPYRQYLAQGVPLVLWVPEIQLIYKYVNATYFELDMKLYYASYAFASADYGSYNITARFLVNMKDWNAYYWDGHEWRYIGYLPLADRTTDLTSTLYTIYKLIVDRINTITQNKTLVQEIAAQARQAYEKRDSETLLHIAGRILPANIAVQNKNYLGETVKVNLLSGRAVGPRLRYEIPSYPVPQAIPALELFDKNKAALDEAITQYLLYNNSEPLREVLSKNNAFITIIVNNTDIGVGSFYWVFRDAPPPLLGVEIDTLLPASALQGSPCTDKAVYALLDIVPDPSIIGKTPSIKYSNTIPAPLPISKLGDNGTITVAVDYRLAYRWMLLSRKAVDPLYREHLLGDLQTGLTNTLVRDLELIASGQNPEKIIENYKIEAKGLIESTAYDIAGKTGVELVDTVINNGEIRPPTITTSTSTTTKSTQTTTHTTTSTAAVQTSSQKTNTSITSAKQITQTSTNTAVQMSPVTHVMIRTSTKIVHRLPTWIIDVLIAGIAALMVAFIIMRRRS